MLDNDGRELSLSQISAQLADWIDPKLLVHGEDEVGENMSGYSQLAVGVCRESCSKPAAQIKAAFSVISKIPLAYDDESATKLMKTIINDLLEVSANSYDIHGNL